jgi:hypothetical protein
MDREEVKKSVELSEGAKRGKLRDKELSLSLRYFASKYSIFSKQCL